MLGSPLDCVVQCALGRGRHDRLKPASVGVVLVIHSTTTQDGCDVNWDVRVVVASRNYRSGYEIWIVVFRIFQNVLDEISMRHFDGQRRRVIRVSGGVGFCGVANFILG